MTQLVLKQGDYTVNLNSEIISNIKDRQEYLDVLVDEIIKELKANYKLSEEVEEHIDSVFYAAEIFDCEIDSIFDNPLTDEEVFSFILKDAGLVKEFNPFEIIPGSQEYMDYLNQNGRIVWSLDDYSAEGIQDGWYSFKIDNNDITVGGLLEVVDGQFNFEQINGQVPEVYKMSTNYWYIEDYELVDKLIIFKVGS